jgi:hypothetical protein
MQKPTPILGLYAFPIPQNLIVDNITRRPNNPGSLVSPESIQLA